MPVPLIAAGIGAGGSLLGGILGNRKSKEEKNALTKQSALADSQTNLANYQKSLMEEQWGLAKPMMGKMTDWYSALAGGNRNAILGNYASTMEGINSSYNAANRDIMSNVPRGGEMSLALAQNRMGKARDMGSIFQGAQNQGIQGLSGLYALLSGNGQSAGQGAQQGYGSASNMYNNLLNYGAQNRQNSLGIGQAVGGSLWQILKQYLNGQQNGGSNNSGGEANGFWYN